MTDDGEERTGASGGVPPRMITRAPPDGATVAAALVAVLASFALAPWPHAIWGALFGVLAARVAREDLANMIVPDADLAVLLALGLLYSAFGDAGPDGGGPPWTRVLDAVTRAFVLGGSAYVIAVLYRLMRGREGLGLGDVKLMAVAGVWLPLAAAFHAVTLAALSALAFSLFLALAKKERPSARAALPFAAFLAPAFWLVWLAGAAGR